MLAVAGGKGGCGKTTTTLGLARGFAKLGREPLVVDADLDMPNLHILTGAPPTPGVEAAAGTARLEQVLHRPASHPGVAVVPAGGNATPETLGRALDGLGHWPGPVLIDCPSGAGQGVSRALDRAHRSVLVTTAAPQSIEDAVKTAGLARRLGADPVALLVRDGPAAGVGRIGCRSLPLPEVTGGAVLADPSFRSRCRDVARTLADPGASDAGPTGPGGREE